MLWRVYYGDGSEFDSDHGSPFDAPPTGVICIKQTNRMHGWTLTAPNDYYLRVGDEWWSADAPGFWQYMFTPGPPRVVLFGQSVPDEVYHAIRSRALNDDSFGPKSARSPLEVVE